MSARGRGRAKVSKLKQPKMDKFLSYRNKILKPKKSSSGKSHRHHTIEDDDNANVFPTDIERDDFENDNVSDSLLLASLPNSDSPACKKRTKKVNFQITHKLDVRGFCEQCGIENPENQLCNGQWQIPKRTSTGWLQRNDDSPAAVNDIQSQSISSSSSSSSPPPSAGPLPSSSSSSTSSIGGQMYYNEACAVQDELKLQDDTVSEGHCKAAVNLDTVIIPPRNSTSADLEMWYLKSNDCYKIPAGKSLFVKSTVFGDFTTEHPHTSRIDSITPFNHWLGQPIDANLAIRAGTLNPNFTGYIEVCIFNKGQKELIVKAGAPIAVLKRENYLL